MNVLMLEDFLRGVAEGVPAGASGMDGLRALEIVLAAYRSAEYNEPEGVERTQAPEPRRIAGAEESETRT